MTVAPSQRLAETVLLTDRGRVNGLFRFEAEFCPARCAAFPWHPSLDPARVWHAAGRIAEEVIAHLAGQPGAEVSVTMDIEAQLPNGASEQTVRRAVIENSRTLKFTSHAFEGE